MVNLPAETFHPGEFISDELEARGWGRDDLARRMPGDFTRNALVLDIYIDHGPNIPSMRLGKTGREIGVAFGVSAKFFDRLEAMWLAGQKGDTP